jgi:hypothetical protein
MGQPAWTPDGVTVNVNHTPSAYNVGTITLKGDRDLLVVPLQEPKPRFVVFPGPVAIRVMEFR